MFVSCCDTSEVLGFAEEAFDGAAFLVDVGIVVDAGGAAAVGGDHGDSASLVDSAAEVVGVIGFVGEYVACRQVGDQGMGLGDVVVLAGSNDKAHRVAESIDGNVDFGRQAASAAADGAIFRPPFLPVACWCARTIVLSMIR